MSISNLFARLRAWFRPAPTPAQAIAAEIVKPLKGWTSQLLARLGDPEPQSSPSQYKLPEPLPGVLPAVLHKTKAEANAAGITLAMDGGYEEMLAVDSAGQSPAAWAFTGAYAGPGLTFLGFPFLAELAQISEYRIPAESLSTEMTRTWGTLNSKSANKKAADKIAKILARLDELKVRDLFREAALKTEQFGRSHIYISVANQDDDRTRQTPLVKIGKGELVGFNCIEPYWLTPYSWNSTHPERPDFYKPQSWFVLGRKTHASRLMTFIFREVPDLLKPAYSFSGMSITQLMMPYVQRWLRTAKNVNDMINIYSIVTLATDLQAMLQEPIDSEKGLIARMTAFTQTRDNRGAMLIDNKTEVLTTQNVPLSGLDKLQAQSQEHMATPGRLPLIKFFGIVPSGLNNGKAEGEFQAWYDYVHGLQELGFGAHIKTVLGYVQMDLFGTVDDDLVWEWLNLWEPTPKEEAEIRKADAERDATYLTNQVVDADEVREKLRTDPESGYNGLQGPAPEPESLTDFDLGEQGKENDAGRREAAAETAHERAKELQQNKPEK